MWINRRGLEYSERGSECAPQAKFTRDPAYSSLFESVLCVELLDIILSLLEARCDRDLLQHSGNVEVVCDLLKERRPLAHLIEIAKAQLIDINI